MGGVQGALTLFCGGVAQTCHDDRVVELKEQLVVEEVDGEGQEGKEKEEGRGRIKENAPWILTVDEQSVCSGLEPNEVCGVITALYVHAQHTMCTTQSSKSTASLVYLLRICELHVVVRVHVPLVVVL